MGKITGKVIMLLGGVLLLAAAAALATPPAQKALPEDLFSVTFPDEQHGWACGRFGVVLHTADAGRTWVRQETGIDYTLSSISFPDEHNGWAVGSEGTILHTADGGRTWVKQACPVQYYLMGVHFATPKEGWVVTERTTILHTTDAGKTWQVQFSDMDYILKGVSFADAKNGWAVGEYGYVYKTADGATWTKQAGHFGISDETGEIVAGNYLFGVFAESPTTAWAVGIDSYVTKTEDGGKTWKVLTLPIPKVNLYAVASKKGLVAICGEGLFILSRDGGSTWSSPVFTPQIRYGWLYGVAPRGPGFVTVGWEGAVYEGSQTFVSRGRENYATNDTAR